MIYKNLFYFDIETIGKYKDLESFKNNDIKGYELFKHKYETNQWMKDRSNTLEEAYINNSPVFSSFGRIICISFGYFHNKSMNGYTIKSICDEDEEKIIHNFHKLLESVSNKGMFLSGYYIKGFDIPWILHKFAKYDLDIPKVIDVYLKKPWEHKIVDIAEEWKQQSKTNTSLNELAYELNIDVPDDPIDGSYVHNTYWNEGDLSKIQNHCESDVFNTMMISEKIFKYKIV